MSTPPVALRQIVEQVGMMARCRTDVDDGRRQPSALRRTVSTSISCSAWNEDVHDPKSRLMKVFGTQDGATGRRSARRCLTIAQAAAFFTVRWLVITCGRATCSYDGPGGFLPVSEVNRCLFAAQSTVVSIVPCVATDSPNLIHSRLLSSLRPRSGQGSMNSSISLLEE